MQQVQSPIIPAIAKLIEQNPGTISLGQGIVYYGPPKSSMNRLNAPGSALEFNKYGSSQGLAELIMLLGNKLESENNIAVGSTNKVIVTAGANMAFLNILFAITDPGDEIILNAPYYFNHEMAVNMLNCRAVVIPTDAQYQLRAEKILAAITDKTRAVVTVSPNNPTGAIYPAETLQKINQICADKGIYHISDEAYEYFTYDEEEHFSPASIDGAENHTISLFSLSKAYGFAAWRVGYMVIPEHLREAVIKAQDTNLICPPLASQYAAMGALEAGLEYCLEKLPLIHEVRNELLERLSCLGDFCQYASASGALYLFLKLDTELSDMDVTEYLIENHQVAVIPGHTFGMSDQCYIRVSYGALDKKSATEGIQRLISGLTAIMNK
ncbi:MAG: pyridoxal phosphate-dependent aminotransferase [Gammaproteobacteria bacterium]|nr:MAG: pyridoxal phosphate-dependent aminotransferase [Gammaproteobacteria bacterium]